MINDKLFWNEDIKNDENDINKARYSRENTPTMESKIQKHKAYVKVKLTINNAKREIWSKT